MTSGSLWNHFTDEIDDVDVNERASDGKSFEYKTNIVGETPENKVHHNLKIQKMQTNEQNHQYHP